jgi:hypothetical protein
MEKIVEHQVATAVISSACDWLVVATELPRGGLVHLRISLRRIWRRQRPIGITPRRLHGQMDNFRVALTIRTESESEASQNVVS